MVQLGLGLASCFCLLLLLMSGTGTLGQYDPPCHSNCSWTNLVGEIQRCKQEYGGTGVSVCSDMLSNGALEAAPPAENIEIEYYKATYTPSDAHVTKLNISFDLNLNGSGIYTGAIIEIEHLDPQDNQLYCHYLDFDGDNITDNDLLTQEGSIKRIFFDCSSYLKPGEEYVITIKMMPYTENSKPEFLYYWMPSCYYRQDDAFCQTSEEDLPSIWSPSIYDVDGRGHKHLELVFNLAPYDFDMYLVYLLEKELINDRYQPVSNKPQYCLNLYVNNENVTSTERCPSQDEFQFNVFSSNEDNKTVVRIIWTDVNEAVYFVEMQPRPTSEGQQCSSNSDVSCYIKTDVVLVKERPCEMIPDPCGGDNMRCTVEGSEHVCSCETGFKMENEICVEDRPCERTPNPCEGDNMICTADGLNPICSCETGFKEQNGMCLNETSGGVGSTVSTPEDPNIVSSTVSPPDKVGSTPPPDNTSVILAVVFGCIFGVLVIIFVFFLIRRNQNGQKGNLNSDCEGKPTTGISRKRIFVIHSYDHELHNEVMLKLCIFLSNVCKLEVHTALWSTTDMGIGVNEWMNIECEEADKVLILCSQGTQVKWRATSRQIEIKTREDTMGDLFSTFMRLQGPEYMKNPKKFIIAYMGYSTEEHIPQPLKFLQQYQLMEHVEQMFYRLNNMEKYSATHDFNTPTLQSWDSYNDAGVELKKAIDQMKKKVNSDPDWFFHLNGISADVKQKIFTTQSQRHEGPNPEVSIICDADPSSVDHEYAYQMSALNSLKQNASQPDNSFSNGYISQADSGVNVSANLFVDGPGSYTGQVIINESLDSHKNPLHNLFQDPKEHTSV